MTGPGHTSLGGGRELESRPSDPWLTPFPSTGEDDEGVNNISSSTRKAIIFLN